MIDLPEFLNLDLVDRIDQIAEQFHEEGRVAIPNYFRDDYADAMYQCLDQNVPWYLESLSSEGLRKTLHSEYGPLSTRAKQKLVPKKSPGYSEFEYAFEKFELSPKIVEGTGNRYNPLMTLYFGVNQPSYLALMKKITQFEETLEITTQFSKYATGHYLASHSDKEVPGKPVRLAAHVIGMSRNWNKDWGGCFHFCDNHGKASQRRVPSFNTLVLFKVPDYHYVSIVKTFVKQKRYSTFGWLTIKPE